MSRKPFPPSPFKPDVLSGRVALITGGGSGIGYEIARQLGLHGSKVVLMGRREAPLKAAIDTLAKEGVQAFAVSGDVRNNEDCKKVVRETVARFGKLDVLVNNAAGNFLTPAEDLTPNGFKTVMEIDVQGVFQMTQAAFPHLKEAKDSVVINITATLQYGATWFQSHASAAKSAIDSLTRSYGLEWGEYGIRVNGIAPGPVANTAGMSKLSGGADEDAIAASIVPLGRLVSTWDIGQCAVYLVSSAGAMVTGTVLVVDGANWLMRPAFAPREAIREISQKIEKKSRATGIPTAEKSKL